MHQGVKKSRTVLFIIQVISLIIIGIIIWLAVRAFRRYKEQVVDPEKEHLAEENEKLRTMNRRLTERNQELAEKVSALQRRLAAGPQQSDEHWFG
jgi:large-conductance mechanosensitive channel